MIPIDTPKNNANVCAMKGVTHVVTGITYGMDAYIAFKKQSTSTSSREKIEGELKVKSLREFP